MSLSAAIRFIRTSALDALHHLSDAELLRRFAEERDEAAFRAIVDRYESLVRGASSRITRDRHTIDDAVQATFLTLARKVRTIRRPEALPGWLFRVARSVTDRAQKLSPLPEEVVDPAPSTLDLLSTREMLALFDEELNRLPAAHRSAILLCNLEGLTVEEVAQHLGTTHGTVRGWLQRGREQLRRRLAQRGVQLSAAMTLLVSASDTRATTLARRDSIVQCALGKQPATAAVAQLATTGSSSLLPTMLVGATATVLVSTLLLLLPSAEKEPKQPAKNEAPQMLAVADDSLPEGAVARIGSPRLSHAGVVAAVAISSDNRWLASASSDRNDKSIRVWDLKDGKEKKRFPIDIRTNVNTIFGQAFALKFLKNDSRLGVVDRSGYHCIDLATAKKICDARIINTEEGEVVETTKEIIGSNSLQMGRHLPYYGKMGI